MSHTPRKMSHTKQKKSALEAIWPLRRDRDPGGGGKYADAYRVSLFELRFQVVERKKKAQKKDAIGRALRTAIIAAAKVEPRATTPPAAIATAVDGYLDGRRCRDRRQ